MLALEGKINEMLLHMQKYGMCVEILIVSYFLQSYITEQCYIPSSI